VDKGAIERALARACNVLCNMLGAVEQTAVDGLVDNNVRELHWQVMNELTALKDYLDCFDKPVRHHPWQLFVSLSSFYCV
jgi:hypothetical protein